MWSAVGVGPTAIEWRAFAVNLPPEPNALAGKLPVDPARTWMAACGQNNRKPGPIRRYRITREEMGAPPDR